MDFAKRILGKYGWKDGDGLGKHGDGIVKPLKASMKFDNAGLGADQAASDFNNHWWERVFNEAAQNVEMKTQENGTVGMDLKNADDSVEISTKGYSMKKLKRAKAKGAGERGDARYDNFLQSATLTQAGDEVENPHRIVVDDIEVTKYKTLTDEELFRACGGRTAHKGARHGLKLSGKLLRLERQEQELLAKMQQKQAKKEELTLLEQKKEQKALTLLEQSSKRKKKHKTDRSSAAEETVNNSSKPQKLHTVDVHDDADEVPAIPKKKKTKRNLDAEQIVPQANEAQQIVPQANEEEPVDNSAEALPKKKKKKKERKHHEEATEGT